MVDYHSLCQQLESLLETEPFYVAALSNASALLMDSLADLNWAGFYLMRRNQLVVGPFQGKPACVHIKIGKGVCGTAVARNETILVKDVHAFPGHISCDSASNSEIVIPIHHGEEIVGVLDIDSPTLGRFRDVDQTGLEQFVSVLEQHLVWDI